MAHLKPMSSIALNQLGHIFLSAGLGLRGPIFNKEFLKERIVLDCCIFLSSFFHFNSMDGKKGILENISSTVKCCNIFRQVSNV